MPPIYIAYLNRLDIEELKITDGEILAAIETSLAAQGRGNTVIEPRVHLEPGVANGHFNVLRGANVQRQQEWPGNEHADVAFRAIEVAGEAGEVAEAVKKFLRAERGIKGSTATREDDAGQRGQPLLHQITEGPLGNLCQQRFAAFGQARFAVQVAQIHIAG